LDAFRRWSKKGSYLLLFSLTKKEGAFPGRENQTFNWVFKETNKFSKNSLFLSFGVKIIPLFEKKKNAADNVEEAFFRNKTTQQRFPFPQSHYLSSQLQQDRDINLINFSALMEIKINRVTK